MDRIPGNWEDRLIVYVTGLVHVKKLYSSTIQSYISGIKKLLDIEQIPFNVDKATLKALVRVSKLENDKVKTRLPINKRMLHVLLDQINDYYLNKGQPYLASLYRAMCSLAYHGLLRVGEITESKDNVFVKDVTSSIKTKELQIILRSSKTHGRGDKPKIIQTPFRAENLKPINLHSMGEDFRYCPCKIITHYGKEIRGKSISDNEPFFVYADGSPVKAAQFRSMLKLMIKQMHIDETLYNTQSFRIGACSDLFKRGANLSQLMIWG